MSKIPEQWPIRMTADIAAAYMSCGRSTFLRRVETGQYPQSVQDGGNRYWHRDILTKYADAQFGILEDETEEW